MHHFLLSPGFSQLSLASALWPLHRTNLLLGEDVLHWRCWKLADGPLASDTGLSIDAQRLDSSLNLNEGNLFLLGDLNLDLARSIPWFSSLPECVSCIGAMGEATQKAAELGWLKGYQAVIHGGEPIWPDIVYRKEQFVVDRNRMTCRSGTAPLDMMIFWLGRMLGGDVSKVLSQTLIDERLGTPAQERRRKLLQKQKQTQPKLAEAVELMEMNIEEPLSAEEISTHVGLSQRHLERLFKRYLGCPPSRYYMLIRTEYGHYQLRHSALSIAEIALACGFSSAAHFSTAYKSVYQCSPSDVRK